MHSSIEPRVYLEQENGSHEGEPLAVSNLLIIYRVGLADLVQCLLAHSLLKIVMADKCPLDVPVDHILSWRVLCNENGGSKRGRERE